MLLPFVVARTARRPRARYSPGKPILPDSLITFAQRVISDLLILVSKNIVQYNGHVKLNIGTVDAPYCFFDMIGYPETVLKPYRLAVAGPRGNLRMARSPRRSVQAAAENESAERRHEKVGKLTA